GGLTGRIIPAGLVEFSSWRWALLGSAVVSLAFAITCWLLLPAQQNFHPKEIHFRSELSAVFGHWANKDLATLFIVAFLSMGTFVSMYNFLTFRLTGDFGLSPALAGFTFLFYLSGTWSSARAGTLVARIGHGKTMAGSAVLFTVGIILCAGNLAMTLIGMVCLTVGFFAVHSTASGWGGATGHPRPRRGVLDVRFLLLPGLFHRGRLGRRAFRCPHLAPIHRLLHRLRARAHDADLDQD
uniref:MFS transporter n=1 Tax=uncultured Corynebacterium sp. TaxID=159447 RepID=UPI002593E46C